MKYRFRIYLTLSLLYAALIFYLSSLSNPGDPISFFETLNTGQLRSLLISIGNSDFKFILYPLYIFSLYSDKVIHAMIYTGFGFLLYLTLNNSPSPIFSKYAMLSALFIGTLYGASDEFHQSFVPGRTMSINDLFADIIGLALAQTIIFIKSKLYFRR